MTAKETRERVTEWALGLGPMQTKDVLIEMVLRMIEIEELGFHDESKSPYWDGSGENIDGTEYSEE